eukprot:scaffold90599_cov31-Tisochrysis_lutea.AAC.4
MDGTIRQAEQSPNNQNKQQQVHVLVLNVVAATTRADTRYCISTNTSEFSRNSNRMQLGLHIARDCCLPAL